jgi:secondary thiamine-phosphate synthase enzyme
MSVYNGEIQIQTQGEHDMVDITDDVQRVVHQSHIENGIVCVFVPGSTGTITTVEYEPGLMKDIQRALENIAPRNIHYSHHETWHDDNGRSHVRASIMGPGITVPVRKGRVMHGTWQQLVFLELDTRSRERTILVQVLGE